MMRRPTKSRSHPPFHPWGQKTQKKTWSRQEAALGLRQKENGPHNTQGSIGRDARCDIVYKCQEKWAPKSLELEHRNFFFWGGRRWLCVGRHCWRIVPPKIEKRRKEISDNIWGRTQYNSIHPPAPPEAPPQKFRSQTRYKPPPPPPPSFSILVLCKFEIENLQFRRGSLIESFTLGRLSVGRPLGRTRSIPEQ